jgi:hypothetical protein
MEWRVNAISRDLSSAEDGTTAYHTVRRTNRLQSGLAYRLGLV